MIGREARGRLRPVTPDPRGTTRAGQRGLVRNVEDLFLSDEYGVIHSFGKTNFFYFSLCPRSEIPLFPIPIPSFVYDLFEVSIRQISLPLKNATQYFKIIKFFQKYQ